MTYLDRWEELADGIKNDIDHSNILSLNEVEELNRIISDVMYGEKNWNDIYEA